MHPENRHQGLYDFKKLVEANPSLESYVISPYDKQTIDFSNAKAVVELNRALLKVHYALKKWTLPEGFLCPPVPSRVDYIHHLHDLLGEPSNDDKIKILDIGTGASCIYPLLGNAIFGWQFVGSEINQTALNSAKKNVSDNGLKDVISLRLQTDVSAILDGVILPEDRFDAAMCNPPFFKNEEEAVAASGQKYDGLKLAKKGEDRNFGGHAHELWYSGGEKAFLHNYLYQSSHFGKQVAWFTSLVSKKENVASLKQSHQKLKGKQFEVVPMSIGHKKMRIVAWNF